MHSVSIDAYAALPRAFTAIVSSHPVRWVEASRAATATCTVIATLAAPGEPRSFGGGWVMRTGSVVRTTRRGCTYEPPPPSSVVVAHTCGGHPLLVMPRNVGVSDSVGVYCLYELGKAFVFRASQLVFRWPIVAYLISALSVRPRPIPSARASHSWSLHTRLQLTRGRRVWKLAAHRMPSGGVILELRAYNRAQPRAAFQLPRV